MSHRMTVALGVLLVFAGSTLAQTQVAAPAAAVPVMAEGPVSSVVMPAGWSLPGSDGRFWATADYMYSWFGGASLPPLVTTSPVGTPRATAGVLGQSTTTTLFGNSKVEEDPRSGFHLGAGYWFNPEHTLGLEAGFMMLGNASASFSANSSQFPILARPFLNASTGQQDSQLIGFPGSTNGSINIRATSDYLYSGNLDLTEKSLDLGWFRLISIFGYRFYSYNEGLQADQTNTITDPRFPAGSSVTTNDTFATHNIFNGVDAGFRTQFFWKNFSLDLYGKIALGILQEEIDINGNQTVNFPGSAAVHNNGGILALSSNIGSTNNNHWWILPEAGGTLNWQVNPNVCLRLGYSLLLLDGVARAHSQVNTTLNSNLFPGGSQSGPVQPTFNLNRSDITIQSITVGVVFTY